MSSKAPEGRSGPRQTPAVLLSVDVEPWTAAAAAGDSLGSDGEAGVDKTLAFLGRIKAKATFFVLGSWSARNKNFVKRIADGGHEVASHGWSHRTAEELGRQDFAAEAAQAKAELEDASGAEVLGYRCPNWGISPRTPWALPALKKAGYRYDASVNAGGPFPVIGSWPGAHAGFRGLDEGPLSKPFGVFVNGAWSLGPWTFPWSLALPLRILPYWFLSARIRASATVSLSLHSWELDPPSPKALEGLPALSRAALSWGAGETLVRKMAALLEGRKTFRFRDFLGSLS